MTAVFVHGVPEDHHLWDDLRAGLPGVDSVALDLPGFGTPIPDGFSPTKESYAAWLVSQIEALGAPVFLVGHDWGGILATHVALSRPDLIRCWATDALAYLDPRWVWHDLARIWQTPGAGEEWMAQQDALPEKEREQGLRGFGVPERYARHLSAADPLKNRCILALYRSAVEIHRDWRFEGRSAKPGLLLCGALDPFVAPELSHAAAAALGIQENFLEGLGHWWVVEDPARGAAALRAFLETVSS